MTIHSPELTRVATNIVNLKNKWCVNFFILRFNFVADSNRAVLRFHSDYSIAGAGFSATWQAVDISGCPMKTLTAREGTLMSPNFPHFLITRLDCATTILAPGNCYQFLVQITTSLIQSMVIIQQMIILCNIF